VQGRATLAAAGIDGGACKATAVIGRKARVSVAVTVFEMVHSTAWNARWTGRTFGQEQGGDLEVATSASRHEGRIVVTTACVSVRPAAEEERDELWVAIPAGHVNRLAAVGRIDVDVSAVGQQQVGHVLMPLGAGQVQR
jgi:hypothetical protein